MDDKKKYETMSQIDADEHAIGFRKDKWLRDCGWSHECNFPDSIWRWCKQLPDGRKVAIRRSDAIRLELRMIEG